MGTSDNVLYTYASNDFMGERNWVIMYDRYYLLLARIGQCVHGWKYANQDRNAWKIHPLSKRIEMIITPTGFWVLIFDILCARKHA